MRENNDHAFVSAERLSETPRPLTGGVEEQMNFGFDALTQATLALAYEQRTANLIALTNLSLSAGVHGAEFDSETADLINTRLGLNGDTK